MNYVVSGFIAGVIVAILAIGGIYFFASGVKSKIRKETYLTKKEVAELEKASWTLKELSNKLKNEDVDVESATKALDRIVYDSDLKQVII